MESKLNVQQALNVFQKIVSHGQQVEEGKQLQGITAWSDFDGYTVFYKGHGVQLTIYFHNKYKFDYKHPQQLEDFMEAIKKIDRMSLSPNE